MIARAKQGTDSHVVICSLMLPVPEAAIRLQSKVVYQWHRFACNTLVAKLIWPMRRTAQALGLLVVLAGCASHPTVQENEANDPLESSNRAVFKGNDAVDRAVIKPVAKGYQSVFPQWVRDRIRHF